MQMAKKLENESQRNRQVYSLHLLKEEQTDLPTVRNNLDVELQMQLNAQQVEASFCPDQRKKKVTQLKPGFCLLRE